MGAHFHQHAIEMGVIVNTDIDNIMKFCQLTVVGSVKPNAPGSRSRLDKLEADIQNRLLTMGHHGGMNLREEVNRKGDLGSEP